MMKGEHILKEFQKIKKCLFYVVDCRPQLRFVILDRYYKDFNVRFLQRFPFLIRYSPYIFGGNVRDVDEFIEAIRAMGFEESSCVLLKYFDEEEDFLSMPHDDKKSWLMGDEDIMF